MATKPINTSGIQKATGKSWEHWVEYLDGINARELTHKQIADKVHEHGSPGWWAQTITVAYEQHIGRREPGQGTKGKFNVTASKTVTGSMDEAMKKWQAVVGEPNDFNGVEPKQLPKVTKSDKWRYWNCSLKDGSRVTIAAYQKEPGKTSLGLGHENLASAEQAEQWRAYWKQQLAKLS